MNARENRKFYARLEALCARKIEHLTFDDLQTAFADERLDDVTDQQTSLGIAWLQAKYKLDQDGSGQSEADLGDLLKVVEPRLLEFCLSLVSHLSFALFVLEQREIISRLDARSRQDFVLEAIEYHGLGKLLDPELGRLTCADLLLAADAAIVVKAEQWSLEHNMAGDYGQKLEARERAIKLLSVLREARLLDLNATQHVTLIQISTEIAPDAFLQSYATDPRQFDAAMGMNGAHDLCHQAAKVLGLLRPLYRTLIQQPKDEECENPQCTPLEDYCAQYVGLPLKVRVEVCANLPIQEQDNVYWHSHRYSRAHKGNPQNMAVRLIHATLAEVVDKDGFMERIKPVLDTVSTSELLRFVSKAAEEPCLPFMDYLDMRLDQESLLLGKVVEGTYRRKGETVDIPQLQINKGFFYKYVIDRFQRRDIPSTGEWAMIETSRTRYLTTVDRGAKRVYSALFVPLNKALPIIEEREMEELGMLDKPEPEGSLDSESDQDDDSVPYREDSDLDAYEGDGLYPFCDD